MKTLFFTIFIGWLLFELIEHVAFPLLWAAFSRKKNSPCGPTGLLGKVAEVKDWRGTAGRVAVHGELWKAVSSTTLTPGQRAVIERIEGLTLKVTPLEDPHVNYPNWETLACLDRRKKR